MSQETIAQILSIEGSAVQLYDEAREQAEHMIADAERTASIMREQTLAHVRQQAEQLAAQSEQTAEIERGRIVAQAEAEAHELERVAAGNFDCATRFVLDQIVGRS